MSVLKNIFQVGIPFLIRAITPLHPGSGSRISGLADLPVQREAGTNLPVIYGSSLKGALRSWASRKMDESKIEEIFGPPPGRGDEGMGNAVFLDAKMLFLPVRSLKGVYGWITSPFILKRLKRDLDVLSEFSGNKIGNILFENYKVKENEALASKNSELKFPLAEKDRIVLEDHVLDYREDEMKFLGMFEDRQKFGELKQELERKLAIVHDDVFMRIMERALEITPHIEINKETGTVKNLWFQEDLPSETIMYSIVFTSQKLKGDLINLLNGVVHVGGDITTGLGFARAIPILQG